MLARMKKVYLKERIIEEDYFNLKPIRKAESHPKLSNHQSWDSGNVSKQSSLNKLNFNFSIQKSLLSTIELKANKNSITLITSQRNKGKKKFENVIITKGKTITKK
jgi:hypothetical protein